MSATQTQASDGLSTAELQDLEDEVSLPYTVENVTLMSPGTWNDIKWTGQEIEKGMKRTDFSEDHNNALFLDHEDRDSDQWVGRVNNVRMDGDDMVGDLAIVDKETAIKLEFGAKFGISPKVTGKSDGSRMKNFKFDNFSVVVNPAVKTTFLNSELLQQVEEPNQLDEEELSGHKDKEKMQETVTHEPDFTGTRDGDWSEPTLEEFMNAMDAEADTFDELTEDQKSEIDDHFLVSKSGFPAENYGDLALPVVEVDGELNLNALQNAKARAGQVEGLSEDQVDAVKSMIDSLANDNFEDANFGNGGEMADKMPEGEGEMSKHKDGEMSKHEEMEENDTTQNQDDNITGESTMSEEEQGEAETESPEMDADVDAIAQRVAEILEDDGDEEEEVENEEAEGEDEGEEEEEVENSSDVEASEFDDFQEFVSEKMEQDDMSYVEAAKEFEEAQKSEAEKVREEVEEEMSQQISDLKEEIQELKEQEPEAQRATQELGQQEIEDAREKVEELSDDELHKGVMKQWLADANATSRIGGVE